MAVGFQINGPALVYVGTGTSGASQLLGYTKDGVDVTFTKNYREIFTDLLGPMTPQDFQDMGEVMVISVPLIASDPTVLSAVLNRGDRTSAGEINTPGRVVGQSGDQFKLGVTGSAGSPLTVANAIVRPDAKVRLATVVNPFVIHFLGWPYLAATATPPVASTALYNRTASVPW